MPFTTPITPSGAFPPAVQRWRDSHALPLLSWPHPSSLCRGKEGGCSQHCRQHPSRVFCWSLRSLQSQWELEFMVFFFFQFLAQCLVHKGHLNIYQLNEVNEWPRGSAANPLAFITCRLCRGICSLKPCFRTVSNYFSKSLYPCRLSAHSC